MEIPNQPSSSATPSTSSAPTSERLEPGRTRGQMSLEGLQPEDFQNSHGGASTWWLVLLAALLLEATVPSLTRTWGVLLVKWLADEDTASWISLRAGGLVWTPILFSATWSVTDPWSHTLSAVHGHPRGCAVVGSVLLNGGLLCTGIGAVYRPHSPLLPLLAGVSAGITAGIGASMLSASARLVLSQRCAVSGGAPGTGGSPGSGLQVATTARRFFRSLGQTMAPLFALPLAVTYGPAGAFLLLAGLATHSLLAPVVLRLPAQLRPRKYKRLKEERHRPAPPVDFEVQTETSDDGGSVSDLPEQQQHLPPVEEQEENRDRYHFRHRQRDVTVEAEVHCDVTGERQKQTHVVTNGAVTPKATSRTTTPAAGAIALTGSVGHGQPAATPTSDEPKPLFGDRVQEWNSAYNFDYDGDDDIELFVKRFPVRQGRVARFCWGACEFLQGCRADLRALVWPSFHLSLFTSATCRLSDLGLAILLPALGVARIGARARLHQMAALSAVSGVGGLLFGISAHWEAVDPTRSRRTLLSAASAVAAVGFYLLSWARSQWWLMLGALAAGYGTSGVGWAQPIAVRDALGGASLLRCQPLLSVLTGLITLASPVLSHVELPGCLAILGAMHAIISCLWLLQPHLAPRCW